MSQLHVADIVVIGGGSAGICAAIAAARLGSRVILVERSDQLGGMGTLAMVHTFCGLYHPDTSLPPQIANPGLPAEIERLTRELTGAEPIRMGKVYVLPQQPDVFAVIAENLTSAEKDLGVWFQAACTGITQHPDETFTVQVGARSIACRALVDCSADAIVADFLGATRLSTTPDTKQRAASIFLLKDVDPAAACEEFRMRLALEIVRAVNAGDLPAIAMGSSSRASTRPGEIYFTTDLDPAPRPELLERGRSLAESLTRFLRGKFPEYANASGPFLASEPGIRESYRWKGRYVLTADDLVNATEFPDTIAYATWPIELREDTRGPKFRFFKQPVPAPIPLRALTSAEINGVYFAGRCISATHEALASLRVMGTCFATGQAAGIAAVEYHSSIRSS